jgi:cytidylate kinase
MKKIVIAVDGPAASGKGTIARRIAESLHLAYLDTGSVYRAVAYRMLEQGKAPSDLSAAQDAAAYVRDHAGSDLFGLEALRSDEVAQMTSKISAIPEVRHILMDLQRNFAYHPLLSSSHHAVQGSVLDGRDIGTVVCPDADVKLFITASTEVRADRRTKELHSRGTEVAYATVLQEMKERDERDSSRAVAPLKPAKDAIIIDTSNMTADEAFEAALAAARDLLAY